MSDKEIPELQFTGERLIPGQTDPGLFNEHFARYVYARMFAAGRTVLDTGCGVGYGSSYLAECARSVVGLDNDARTIQYARSRYCRSNTHYIVGDCKSLPFGRGAFELVTSFEVIEHLSEVEAYLAEVRRILEPGGVFLVSTPNRPVYAAHRGPQPNPFHIREWDLLEFSALLRSYFKFVEVLGETHLPAVGILRHGKGVSASAFVQDLPSPTEADYFVCVCSQEPQKVGQILFTSSSANVLLERERHIRSLVNELTERNSYLARLQPEFEEKARWANDLNDEVTRQKTVILQLREQTESLAAQVETLTSLLSKTTRRKRLLVFSALAPLSLVIGCAVIGTEMAGRLARSLKKHPAPLIGPKDTERCSIVIPSWNGKALLAESLPPLKRALQLHGREHEIILVDNGSTDGTGEYVREHFPEVRVVRSEQNLFFGGGTNLGVEAATREIVVLLNNDMLVGEDFLAPLLSGFASPDVFAVASQVFHADPRKKREETGKTRARFNGWDLDWSHDPILPCDVKTKYVAVFWGHGGAVALDRQKFLWLGGFDPRFDPFYVEDADVSYRAWKVGWQCLLAVDSKVVHKHRGTIAPRFSPSFINQIIRRNQYFFIWKNFGDITKLLKHFVTLPRRQMRRAGIPGAGTRLEAKAFLGAAKRLRSTLAAKFQLSRSVTRTDDEILRLTNTPALENIVASDLDFVLGDFEGQLGEGWQMRETVNGQSFRWMSKHACAFLRAPAEIAQFYVRGWVSGSGYSGRARVVLSVNCHGDRRRFKLREGPFEERWTVSNLQPGDAVEVRLSVDRVLSAPSDHRILGLMINRVALSAGRLISRPFHNELLPTVSISNPPPTEQPAINGQRRVLMVCAYLPCLGLHGGGDTMFNLIRTLSKRHRLTVLSFYEDQSDLKRIEQLAPYCEQLEAIYRGQTPDAPNPFGLKPPEIVYEFYHRQMKQLVEDFLRIGHFDLLQCEYLQTAHYALMDPAIPAILSEHEVLSLAYLNRYRNFRWRSSQKFKALLSWMRMLNYEEKMLRRFARIAVRTRPEREFLAKYAPRERVHDHPTGVDSEFFCPTGETAEDGTIVFVGNFKHAPNLRGIMWFLRDAWTKIRTRYPKAKLNIVGANPSTELLEFHGQVGVTVTGWVEDVRPFLRQASVFVAPIFDGVGLRTKVLEAWAMGKPVVGTQLAFAGLTDIDGTVCLMAEKTEEFVTRICLLLENTELAKKMGTQARQLVLSDFSWDAFGQFYESLYAQILEPKAESGRMACPSPVGLESREQQR